MVDLVDVVDYAERVATKGFSSISISRGTRCQ